MRVARNIGERVMLAMHCDPFLGLDTRGEPDEGAEKPGSEGMQGQRSMAESAMQIHGGARIGHRGHNRGGDEGNKQAVEKSAHGQTISHYLLVGRPHSR